MKLTLSGQGLSIDKLAQAVTSVGHKIELSAKAKKQVARARAIVDDIVHSEHIAYGINTGFGRLSDYTISKEKIVELQENLLKSHAVGVGPELSPEEVRAMLVLRMQSLLQGHSGVRFSVIEKLAEFFNKGLIPVVPEQGSCGASGDLSPLAHLSLPFLAEGQARILRGRNLSPVMTSKAALTKLRIKPMALAAKEGLALINGTQAMTAIGSLCAAKFLNLLKSADIVGAMSLEALLGSKAPFHPRIQALRPHPGQRVVAQNLLRLLDESEVMESHRDCGRVQDAYSLRCMPQVHGAARDTLAHASSVLECEMNSVTDNPLIFPDHPTSTRILSGGNFHGQPVAQVLDFLSVSATDLASISERRIERLLNPDLSELPAFFAHQEGTHSGFMMLQVTAASLVSESKSLCFPASADSIPTSANKEDHVSMGVTSARKLRQIVGNLQAVLAIEWLCAAKGLEYRRPLRSSAGVEAAYETLRDKVPTLEQDRVLYPDIQAARDLLQQGELVGAVEKKIGDLA